MSPAAVNDYPRTWSEFLDWFSSEEACSAYLERLRWPLGFVCPNCAVMAAPSRASRGRLLCKDCGHQSTVTAGTIFDKTRTPLKVAGGGLVHHQSKARGQRPGSAACSRVGQLPDRMDHAASLPSSDGAP